RLLPVPTLGLWSARALWQRGRWVAASERYFEVLRLPLPNLEPEVHAQAKADAKAERDALEPTIPRLRPILPSGIAPAEIALFIDGRTVGSELIGAPIPLDPGAHRFVVARGDDRLALTVTLAPGMAVTRMLPVPEGKVVGPPPPSPPIKPRDAHAPPSRPLGKSAPRSGAGPTGNGAQPITGWSLVGVGGAALLAGTVMGTYLGIEHGALDCPDEGCAPQDRDRVDRVNDLRFPTTGLLVGGAVAASVGVTLVMLTSDDDDQAAPPVAVDVTAGSLRLRARF
ncbi:MAG: hypothetical protein AAGN82_30725, partial [Myxococcota bacterium]